MKYVCQTAPHLPRITLSGEDPDEIRRELIATGVASDVIAKPWLGGAVLGAVKRHLLQSSVQGS